MKDNSAILLPLVAMLGIYFSTWLTMFFTRIGEMKSRRIHPQQVASRKQMAQALENTQPADHWNNLFEAPVLFLLLLLLLVTLGWVDNGFVILAWIFVALRAVQAFIHLTYNKVYHRFYAYLSGSVVLWLMWIRFGIEVVSQL